MHKTTHLRDEELLGFADGELESAQASAAENHLASCWQCRTRRAEIEGTIADFVRQRNQDFCSRIPPAEGPRALLRARLAEAVRTESAPRWSDRLQFIFSPGRFAYIGVTAMLLLIGLAFWRYAADLRQKQSMKTVVLFEPRPELTPGAVRSVSLADICGGGPSEKNRVVSASLQREVFRNYGIVNARPQDYEVDYLITPELGGADDIRNLWPQPFTAKNWSAYTKDDLEDRIHELVCSGKLDLSTAQHAIATDWIGAYKKYVRDDDPVEKSGIARDSSDRTIAKLSSIE